MKNIRRIPELNKSLRLAFASQLFEAVKLKDFQLANEFLHVAFARKIASVRDVDIYVTKFPLYHSDAIVYSTLIHAGEEVSDFWIKTDQGKVPFRVTADSPIIVVNGSQDSDGVQLSVIHEVVHLIDEEPDEESTEYMSSPREQRARSIETAFCRWLGMSDEAAQEVIESRYLDASDLN